MNPPNLLKFCLKMWSFLTSVFSPEHSVAVQAPLVQGCPLFHESGPEALPLPMGTRWIWHTKQALPGLHSAPSVQGRLTSLAPEMGPSVTLVEATWTPCLTERGPSTPAAWSLLRKTLFAWSNDSCSPDESITVCHLGAWQSPGNRESSQSVSPGSSFSSVCSPSPALFFLSVPLPIPAVSFLPSWTCCCLLRTDSSAQGTLPWGAPTPPPSGWSTPHLHPAGALPSAPPSCWSTPTPHPARALPHPNSILLELFQPPAPGLPGSVFTLS